MRSRLLLTSLVTFGTLKILGCGTNSEPSLFVPDPSPPGPGTMDASTPSEPDFQVGTQPDASVRPDTGTPNYGGSCKPRVCADVGATCGPVADGCGGIIECGTCKPPATCGGGGIANQCGGMGACVPKTCAEQGIDCGQAGDGCGGVIQCGSCQSPNICGGGGVPGKCGGGNTCTPKAACDPGIECGAQGDGCGGLVYCGPLPQGACPDGKKCGYGGPGLCGGATLPDGGPVPDPGTGSVCTPKTCSELGANCGTQGDGCGGLLNCGSCSAPFTCGGGGTPNQCGGAVCTPKTAGEVCQGRNCGFVPDGCGGVVSCGICPSNQACGGGGQPNVCGGSAGGCRPKTCSELNANCGPVGDGCGGIIQSCGTCTSPAICGGSGVPSQCGAGGPGGGPTCSGLQCQQVACTGSQTTEITGTVYDPAGQVPLYNALVYIPNYPDRVEPFKKGVTCSKCGADATGTPLVRALTGPDGRFKLTNVPVGENIPVIIQVGRWRRRITITPARCGTTEAPAQLTRLPRNKSEGDIPLMAISTGYADPLECLLLKMGIDSSEFTPYTGSGRVHYFRQQNNRQAGRRTIPYNGVELSSANGGPAPPGSALWSSYDTLANYDMVLLPCEGNPENKVDPLDYGTQGQANIKQYANSGGRLFFTHYAYAWAKPIWPGVANWNVDQPGMDQVTGTIDTSFQKGKDFADWLQNVGATSTYGQLLIKDGRHDVDTVNSPPTQRWIYTNNSPSGSRNAVFHMTFNTPVSAPADAVCGRVVYSDFHVSAEALNGGPGTSQKFPEACIPGPLSNQEKALEFMLFDLANCVQDDGVPPIPPPTCKPRSCAEAGANCGPIADGCGNIIECGTCTAPFTCGGGGQANVCGGCAPLSCEAMGQFCGQAGDGCGGLLDCGTCTAPQTCGGGGEPGRCGGPICNRLTCAQQNITCGPAGDGCGGQLDCGSCPAGQTCGGGGIPGQCGAIDGGSCKPIDCAIQNLECGPAGDGCGGILNCGNCTSPQTCGGGGIPGKCGAPSCKPKTCAELGADCGPIGDGCGNIIDCGTCHTNETCGAGGFPNKCGTASCKPRTCADYGYNCGQAGDGCGGIIECGVCTAPETCGGGGTANRCGNNVR